MADTLEQHEAELEALREGLELERRERDEGVKRERELEKIVEEVRTPLTRFLARRELMVVQIVGIGLRGGWLEGARSPDWEERARGAGQRWEDRERGTGEIGRAHV